MRWGPSEFGLNHGTWFSVLESLRRSQGPSWREHTLVLCLLGGPAWGPPPLSLNAIIWEKRMGGKAQIAPLTFTQLPSPLLYFRISDLFGFTIPSPRRWVLIGLDQVLAVAAPFLGHSFQQLPLQLPWALDPLQNNEIQVKLTLVFGVIFPSPIESKILLVFQGQSRGRWEPDRLAPHVTAAKGQKPTCRGGNSERQTKIGSSMPGYHDLLVTANLCWEHLPQLAVVQGQQSPISFQGPGICGTDGEMLEMEESQFSNPAESVPHLARSVSTCRMLLIYHRLFQEQQSVLKVAFQTFHKYSSRVRHAMPLQWLWNIS